ncbi:MAG TPA: hypothetical protein VLI92_04390 [Candidatus Saccharimonadales bacterium]|nr:hypothetical protein [Candidatus Saccharimonadales bacterium]
MQVLNSFLIGNWGDQILYIWYGWWIKNYTQFSPNISQITLIGPPGTNPSFIHTQLFWDLIQRFFLLFFDSLAAYNLVLILGFVLSLLVSYKFFHQKFSISISVCLTGMFVFSTYFFEQVKEHGELSQLWIVPLFFIILNKILVERRFFKLILYGLVIASLGLFSNYYGFFIVLTLGSSGLFYLVKYIKFKELQNLVKIKNIFITLFICGVAFFIILFPYVKSYFNPQQNTNQSEYKLVRNYSDFFIFSSRPWYYVLPSIRNPSFGFLSKNILERLQATHYFLFNNYFPEEHGGSFVGWVVIALFLYSLFNKRTRSNSHYYIFLIVILFLFSMPPFFTLLGVKIPTLGILVSTFFKMFRTTARLAIFILLLMLYVSGFTLTQIEKRLPQAVFILFLVLVLVFNVSQTYVPVRVTNVTKIPEVYSYILNNTNKDAIVVAYPDDARNLALFWMMFYQRRLINPRDYVINDFDSNKFTTALDTEAGLKKAKDLQSNYLIVSKNTLPADILFFSSSSRIKLVKSFSDSYLYQLN